MEGTTHMREQDEMRLHAYHDGELSGFARWRFERALRRSPDLQRELDALRSLSSLMSQQEAGAPGIDLWDLIALGLPAADTLRAEEPEKPSVGHGAGWWLKPIGAVAVTAAFALAYLYPGAAPTAPTSGNVVRWIDSGERGVVVLEDDPDSTIIWVMDDAVDGAAIGGGRDLV